VRRDWLAVAACIATLLSIGELRAEDAGVAAGVDAGADAGVDAGAPSPRQPVPVEAQMGSAETLTLTPSVRATIRPPKDWTGTPDRDGSFTEQLKEIPGAQVIVARIWKPSVARPAEGGRGYGDSMELVCVQAPVSEWAPGMHLIVFERMNSIARGELGKGAAVDTFDPGPVEDTGKFFRQRFSAHGELEARGAGGEKVLVEDHPDRPHSHAKAFGMHILTVPAGSNSVIGCTLFCGELERPGQKTFQCEGPISSFSPEGDLVSEPEYTLTGRFVSGVRQSPWTIATMLLGALMLMAGAVITGRTLVEIGRGR